MCLRSCIVSVELFADLVSSDLVFVLRLGFAYVVFSQIEGELAIAGHFHVVNHGRLVMQDMDPFHLPLPFLECFLLFEQFSQQDHLTWDKGDWRFCGQIPNYLQSS